MVEIADCRKDEKWQNLRSRGREIKLIFDKKLISNKWFNVIDLSQIGANCEALVKINN